MVKNQKIIVIGLNIPLQQTNDDGFLLPYPFTLLYSVRRHTEIIM